jgi:hypothetical protein
LDEAEDQSASAGLTVAQFLERNSWTVKQGCQIFLGTAYQEWKNAPNDHKIYPMDTKSQMAVR